jgi:hypothetical protein
MRVDVLNLATANFYFPSIISSKSLFAENPTGSPAESQSRSIREQKSLCVNLEKLSAVEKEKSTHPLITHCINLDKTKCSSSRRKMRRREKRRMKEVEASFESSVLCV